MNPGENTKIPAAKIWTTPVKLVDHLYQLVSSGRKRQEFRNYLYANNAPLFEENNTVAL